MNKFLINFSRLFTGAVFVFSGFVKAVDPLGTAYKLEDYFAAYNMLWANDLSLVLAIFLCAVELLVGVALLLNLRMRLTSWVLLLMMSFFTVLTFYDALYDPVPDCGCFGDAITLTNWETFYKNVVLMVFTLIVFVNRKRFKAFLKPMAQWIAVALLFILFVLFSFYNYIHLPMLDFRSWKIGNQMASAASSEERIYLSYQSHITGEIQEYLSPDFPWNDSLWLAEWEFVEQRVERDVRGVEHDLKAEDEFASDFTDYLLESPGIFVFVSYDLEAASAKGMQKLAELEHQLFEAAYPSVILTASLPETAAAILQEYDIHSDLLFADDIVLKTIVRANPGLVMFYNGYVAGKWHYNDMPNINELLLLLEDMSAMHP